MIRMIFGHPRYADRVSHPPIRLVAWVCEPLFCMQVISHRWIPLNVPASVPSGTGAYTLRYRSLPLKVPEVDLAVFFSMSDVEFSVFLPTRPVPNLPPSGTGRGTS